MAPQRYPSTREGWNRCSNPNCSIGVEQELETGFSKHGNGYSSQCKKCVSVYRAAYNAEHREEKSAVNAAYRAEHREEIAAYRAEHREERSASDATYRAAHREERAACYAAWATANPEKIRVYDRRNSSKRRTSLLGNYRSDYADTDWNDGHCGYCLIEASALPSDQKLQVDHIIPISKCGPDCPENLIAACRTCNASKRNKSLRTWQHGKYIKILEERIPLLREVKRKYDPDGLKKWPAEILDES